MSRVIPFALPSASRSLVRTESSAPSRPPFKAFMSTETSRPATAARVSRNGIIIIRGARVVNIHLARSQSYGTSLRLFTQLRTVDPKQSPPPSSPFSHPSMGFLISDYRCAHDGCNDWMVCVGLLSERRRRRRSARVQMVYSCFRQAK